MPGPGSYWIGEEEKKEILDVLESGYVFRYGELDDPAYKRKVYTYEKELAAYTGTRYALATTSGSASLIVSLLALGIGPGDEVIVPAYTFVATFSSVIFTGATPILTEIDESLNIDPTDIEKRITSKTKAIIPVHMLGNACDMDAIMAIAKKHNLAVLEDACQAVGGSYKGHALGSIGDMGAYSLNVFKMITAGDGGSVITHNEDLYTRAFALHDQGHTPNRAGVQVGDRSILGMNFRMNELTGAVALAQLRKLDRIVSALREKKKKFKDQIKGIPGVSFRKLNDPTGDCATLCTVLFELADHAKAVAAKLDSSTVDQSGWHVYANMEHVNEYLKNAGLPYGKGAYPQTDDILSRSINLSVGVVDAGLGAGFGIDINSTDEEIKEISERFRQACSMV
ncbi:DegT/DnrJ/EryC1/StrS family aminotransferase [candidate division KSB1 bacterium]|nr:DegT/DnrJ/EryC1/StrS family aminotransferase [candidate division KSB1 bacterium]